MDYLVFPFGKYKGTPLEEIPSTYIVFAIETFDLPDELNQKMWRILLGRLKVYSVSLHLVLEKYYGAETREEGINAIEEFYNQRIKEYEREEGI